MDITRIKQMDKHMKKIFQEIERMQKINEKKEMEENLKKFSKRSFKKIEKVTPSMYTSCICCRKFINKGKIRVVDSRHDTYCVSCAYKIMKMKLDKLLKIMKELEIQSTLTSLEEGAKNLPG